MLMMIMLMMINKQRKKKEKKKKELMVNEIFDYATEKRRALTELCLGSWENTTFQ